MVPGYYPQTLDITAVRHALIVFADVLGAISMVGFVVIVGILFLGAHASAAAETGRRRS